MSETGVGDAQRVWQDSLIAARLFAGDPAGLGGIILRAGAGPVRDRWMAQFTALLPAGMALRKLPVHAGEEMLLGGLDLAATLDSSKPVARRGLLAEADGGIVIVAMAERMTETAAAQIAVALDRQIVTVEREGLALVLPARIGLIALDEGATGDERPPPAIAERCAFLIDLTLVSIRDLDSGNSLIERDTPVSETAAIEALCATAAAFGIDSARAPILALRAARGGRAEMTEADLAIAVRLVLVPRAMHLPMIEDDDEEPEDVQEPAPPPPESEGETQEQDQEISALTEIMVEAVRAALPPDVLAAMEQGGGKRSAPARGSGQGAKRKGLTRGRPAGVRAGDPGRGARLSLVDTLRTAAPWQKLRRMTETRPGIIVRRADFRVKRYEERAESTTIFLVDASGSAALERLAETKGAVELLLAEAYVRRTQVAMITFRGTGAEILLPPTRSLARAKKCLADLAGGGGTPLCAGLEAGQLLAEAAASKGRTPFIVLMTDGRANVGRDGLGGREKAEAESLAAARRIRAAGFASVLIDIAARPRPEASALAAAMGARYAPLPRMEAAAVRDLVRQ